MKRISIVMTFFLINALFFAGQSFGRWSGWENTTYARMYNVNTVETISGAVTSVDQFIPAQGMWPGIHIIVETAAGKIPVHLGPVWYISNQNMQIAVNDTVNVTGSKIVFNGAPAIIAAQVTKGANILTLRDNNGFSVWSGWRGQHHPRRNR